MRARGVSEGSESSGKRTEFEISEILRVSTRTPDIKLSSQARMFDFSDVIRPSARTPDVRIGQRNTVFDFADVIRAANSTDIRLHPQKMISDFSEVSKGTPAKSTEKRMSQPKRFSFSDETVHEEASSDEDDTKKQSDKFQTPEFVKIPSPLTGKTLVKGSQKPVSRVDGISRISIRAAKESVQKCRIVGTPDYMAPEIVNGITINDPASDLWSVGCLLFEFLTGFPPFNDDDVEKIFQNIRLRKIPWDLVEIGK